MAIRTPPVGIDPRDKEVLKQTLDAANLLGDTGLAADMKFWLAVPSDRMTACRIRSTYFLSPKPCRRNHISLRYTSTGNCIECLYGVSKQYRRGALTDNMPYSRIYQSGHVAQRIRSLAIAIEESDGRNGITLARRVEAAQRRFRVTYEWSLIFMRALHAACIAKKEQSQVDLDRAADLAQQGVILLQQHENEVFEHIYGSRK